jgi:hypothetical protein
VIIRAQVTELVEKEVFVLAMTTGVLAFLTSQEIVLKEFAHMILHGLIPLTIQVLTINMLNVPTEEFAIVKVESVIAFPDMKAKVVKELLAQMTALVMVVAHIFRICHMLLSLKTTFTEISEKKCQRLSIIINGTDPKLEDASVMLNMEMSIAPRECACMALM